MASETGANLIASERCRQLTEEGWTAEHDAGHVHGELARAALAYTWFALGNEEAAIRLWPFTGDFKPVRSERWDVTRSLIKAGALIAAEIDRLTAERAVRAQIGETDDGR